MKVLAVARPLSPSARRTQVVPPPPPPPPPAARVTTAAAADDAHKAWIKQYMAQEQHDDESDEVRTTAGLLLLKGASLGVGNGKP